MKTSATLWTVSLPGRSRFADYVAISKPRLTVMALMTVAAGAFLASESLPDWPLLLHTLIGAGLVAVGSSALNQYLERDLDAQMVRTSSRPLPSGRMQPAEVLTLGIASGAAGVAYLLAAAPYPLAGVLALVTLVGYVFIYTPLKRTTSINTLVGAIPGALPPMIGWTAVRGTLNQDIATVFLMLFLWQIPHFLAIAWLYREDYRRAGMCMLPVMKPDGFFCGRQMVLYTTALALVSLAPAWFGWAGMLYLLVASLLGLFFLASTVAFARWRSDASARFVLRVSLCYLPVILAVLLVDRIVR